MKCRYHTDIYKCMDISGKYGLSEFPTEDKYCTHTKLLIGN